MRLMDIAKKLGVSHTTVSRALNPSKRHLISDSVAKKVLESARQLGYRSSRPARALATGRSRTIGLILPTMFNSPFFNEQTANILGGMLEILDANKPFACRITVPPHMDETEEIYGDIVTDDMEGLLISSHVDHSLKGAHYLNPQLITKWKGPVVAMNLELGRSKSASVVAFSNYDAAFKAVTHLVKRKHRTIAMIYGDKLFEDSLARYKGYETALKDHSLSVHSSLVKQGHFSEDGGYAATIQFFKQKGPKPDAIFCANDQMAIGVLHALEVLRIQCPREVAVMGFDGLELGHCLRPRLSSVRQPIREIAKVGTQLLIDLIEKRVSSPQIRIVPSELILRESA